MKEIKTDEGSPVTPIVFYEVMAVVRRSEEENDTFEVYSEKVDQKIAEWICSLR